MLGFQEASWVDEPAEPSLAKQALAEMPANRKPQKVTSKDTQIGSDEHREGLHCPLANQDACRDIDRFFANGNTEARSEKQHNHGQWAIVTEEFAKWAEFIHAMRYPKSPEEEDYPVYRALR